MGIWRGRQYRKFLGASQAGSTNPGGANSSGTSVGALAGGAIGVGAGLASGKPTGYASAGIQGTKLLANNTNTFGANSGTVNNYAGGASNALGIYSGIKQGGVAGDTSAAVNAAQLGARFGAFGGASGAVGAAAGYVAAPLALYNAVENYKSGATGSDTLNGAEAGAAIGSIIPGIGTVIGGVIGGVVGAISSAFGPGAKDAETSTVQNLIDYTGAHGDSQQAASSVQNPYLELAGLFDRHESTLPMYQQYGRMGEQKFTNDMAQQINSAIQKDPSLANNPDAVYSKVVAPWVNNMGSGWGNVGSTYAATTQGLLKDMVGQYLGGSAANNWKSVGGDTVFSDIYSGSSIKEQPAYTPPQSKLGIRNKM